jgi:hypothetical protein
MNLFEHFPYTNFHDLNLDWLLKKVKELVDKVAELGNKITDLISDNNKNSNAINDIYQTLENTKGIPAGGMAEQVLTKKSDKDYDVEWTDSSSSEGDYLPLAGGAMYEDAKVTQEYVREDPDNSTQILRNNNTITNTYIEQRSYRLKTQDSLYRSENNIKCSTSPDSSSSSIYLGYLNRDNNEERYFSHSNLQLLATDYESKLELSAGAQYKNSDAKSNSFRISTSYDRSTIFSDNDIYFQVYNADGNTYSPPKCEASPTEDSHLVNKEYVDENAGAKLPDGGTDGQVLARSGDDSLQWVDQKGGDSDITGVPDGGSNGQVLTRSGTDGLMWTTVSAVPDNLPGAIYYNQMPFASANDLIYLDQAGEALMSERTYGVMSMSGRYQGGGIQYIINTYNFYITFGVSNSIPIVMTCVSGDNIGKQYILGTLMTNYSSEHPLAVALNDFNISPALFGCGIILQWLGTQNYVNGTVATDIT